MSETLPPPPWHAFFLDLDDALSSAARLDCIGGFVVSQLYGFSRPTADVASPPWLLLVFTLPSAKASERVQIWRKLQKFGSIPFRNAGYILPNDPLHQERFEWVATAVRGHGGEASVLQIQAIDDASPAQQQRHSGRPAARITQP